MGKDIARVEVPSPKKNRLSPRFFLFFFGGGGERASVERLQSWTKVLGHFCMSGAFPSSHRPNTSPRLTNKV